MAQGKLASNNMKYRLKFFWYRLIKANVVNIRVELLPGGWYLKVNIFVSGKLISNQSTDVYPSKEELDKVIELLVSSLDNHLIGAGFVREV